MKQNINYQLARQGFVMLCFFCLSITGLSQTSPSNGNSDTAHTQNQRDVSAAHGRTIEGFPYPFAQTFYIQPRFDRQNYDDGTYFNSYVLRAFSTYWKKMHFRVEIPLANTNTSGKNVFGLSDITLRAVRAVQLHDKIFFGYGVQLVMNTATDRSLGGGKWDLRPTLGAIYFIGQPDNIKGTIVLGFDYRFTLAKQDGRTATSMFTITPNFDWWFKKWYIGYYATWSYDFESKIFDLPLDIEAGYFFLKSLTVAAEFVQPLLHPRSYKNEFAVKVRYSFLNHKKQKL